MAGLIPLVFGSGTAMYPVTRRVEFLTRVHRAIDDTEQRAKIRVPLTRVTLPYHLNATDMAAFRAFIGTQKGPYAAWSVCLGRSGSGTVAGTTVTCATADFTAVDVGCLL